jgi:hypothetical protein
MTLPGLLNRRDRMLLVKTNMLFEGADSVEPCETDLFGCSYGFRLLELPAPDALCTEVAGQGTALFGGCKREFTFRTSLDPFPRRLKGVARAATGNCHVHVDVRQTSGLSSVQGRAVVEV